MPVPEPHKLLKMQTPTLKIHRSRQSGPEKPLARKVPLAPNRETLRYAAAVHHGTLALALGLVSSDSVVLRYDVHSVAELLHHYKLYLRHDLIEFSLGRLVQRVTHGASELVGLPIFPARAFRHSAIYVRADSPHHDPKALEGARVGIPRWTQTAGIWARGHLAEDFGVQLREIDWYVADVSVTGGADRSDPDGPESPPQDSGFRVVKCAQNQFLDQLLTAGRVDAVISAVPLPTGSGAPFRHLLEDPFGAERDFYRRTGCFPIMHLVVAQRAVLERSPGLPARLVDLFNDAAGYAQSMWGPHAPVPFSGLAWESEYYRLEHAIFNDRGPMHGLEANSANWTCLQRFLRYASDQGICARELEVTDVVRTS